MSNVRPSVIDLFAGVGGLSLGLEAAGCNIVAAVEYDPVHAAAHHFNFPYSTTICADVAEVKSSELTKALEKQGYDELDILVGGPPCQGFSTIGKRQLDDPRNKLVFEYLRIVKELKPKYFIFENVPGMMSGKHVKFVNELIEEFQNAGYKIHKPIKALSAADYGVPQKRRRLVLLGSRSDVQQVHYPASTHHKKSRGESAKLFKEKEYIGALDAIGDLADNPVYLKVDEGLEVNKKLRSNYAKNMSRDHKSDSLFKLCHVRADDVLWGHVGSEHTDKTINRFSSTQPGEVEETSRFFKLHTEYPCNTIRAGTNSDKGAYTAPRPIHYSEPRCISIREAARLHSFPDWFQLHRKIWHGFRQIGNAVAPLFAKHIGDEIVKALGVDTDSIEIKTLNKQNPDLLNLNMTEASEHFDIDRGIIPTRKRQGVTNG